MTTIFTENSWLLILLILWVLPWKGVALWRAARNGDRGWFVAIFLLNTLAILDIIYIFAFSKNKKKKEAVSDSEVSGADNNQPDGDQEAENSEKRNFSLKKLLKKFKDKK